MKKVIHMLPALLCVGVILCGCLAAQVAGDVARSGQKETDVVLAEGVTPAMLQQKKSIAVNINGVNASGQFVYSVGEGSTNAGIYSDMLTKEFLKMGYQSKTITEDISESSGQEKFRALVGRGFNILLIGNMNVSTTTSVTGHLTGGSYANTGVTSFTVKGIDVRNGDILFILSTEYGKAKKASEVTRDLALLYRDVALGKVTPTDAVASSGPRSENAAPPEAVINTPSKEEQQGTKGHVVPAEPEIDIRWVQQMLNERGYACGTGDGVIGPKTRACIKAFQRANGLQATGELNPATVKMLRALE